LNLNILYNIKGVVNQVIKKYTMKKIVNSVVIALIFVLTSSFTNQATLKDKMCNQKWKLVKTIIGEGDEAIEVPSESKQVMVFNSDFTYSDKSGANEEVNFSSKWEILDTDKTFKLYLDESMQEFTEVHIEKLDDKTLHFKYELDDVMQFVYEAI